MKLTDKQIAKACERYSNHSADRCELSVYDFGQEHKTGIKRDINHIFGRRRSCEETNWFCNLILLDSGIHHEWFHGVEASNAKIAVLWVKLQRHRWYRDVEGLPADETLWHWHPAAASKLVIEDGLRGRIYKLSFGATGKFKSMAEELLEVLKE